MEHAGMTPESRRWLDEPFPFNVEIALAGGWTIWSNRATSPRGGVYQLDHSRTHARRVAS
jgi:hypothetical protein